jgi:hypothetical protein
MLKFDEGRREEGGYIDREITKAVPRFVQELALANVPVS